MRAFVTGSTGFIGSAVVKELLAAGHQVLGLCRSDAGAAQLKSVSAEPLRGCIEDLEILKQGAAQCDAVIHLGFVPDFANFVNSCATNRAAIHAMGSALAAAAATAAEAGAATDRALVVSSGTMMLKQGEMGDEDDVPDTTRPMAAAGGQSERVCLDFARQGVRASVIRLPPTTHGPGASGFMGPLVAAARQHGVSAYVGAGQNHWCAGHRNDAAILCRLAMEKAEPGSVFHAVGEDPVSLKAIATALGAQLHLPVVSIAPDKIDEHFGWFKMGVMADNIASSIKTKQRLEWAPAGPTLLQDIPTIVTFLQSSPASS